ncbi:thyroid hormone receptor interactor 10b [Chanos chanos]|uniref:Thyroid hormone receptor interactor 10b n=1 Tax=Chanos chanos TaxID=29144 RepID=A0A6J2VW70_CHACN|nr:cdc42-interacting protein 4 homolog [Chanos chanos]
MDWGTDLWDQHEAIEKHTQNGLDLVERYVKFVKERTEIEQNYAKQLRSLSKKYARRGKDDQESKFSSYQAFQDVLSELSDYAGQRELVAENMTLNICVELTKYLHDLKQERKTYLGDIKKAQQNLELSLKQLENSKKRFEKEWKEAEKANQQSEKVEQDTNSTKADVDKAKQQAFARMHTADECKNDYASQLQKYNREQNQFYYADIPTIFNKLQQLDERRIRKLAEGYVLFAETEKKVMPIIGKCLDGICAAGSNTSEKQDSLAVIEMYKTGIERPADIEFEDYSQGAKPTASENTHTLPKVRIKNIFKGRHKPPPSSSILPDHAHAIINSHTHSKFSHIPISYCLRSLRRPLKYKNVSMATSRPMVSQKDHRSVVSEDYSHLPPEQRKKHLQQKIDDVSKELQKEMDQSEALSKMRGVYEQNPQLGDAASLEPQITQTSQNIGKLKGELAKYETWLNEASGLTTVFNDQETSAGYISVLSGPVTAQPLDDVYEDGFGEFDEDVDEPVGQCTALYNFDGSSEGTVSVQEGEQLSVMEEDQGDGWMRVRKSNGDEGYVPSSYIKIS